MEEFVQTAKFREFSRAESLPEVIEVPLDPMMHFSLGQIRDAHREPSKTMLLILRSGSLNR